jgi:membrane-associated phospholipid phosphatase
MKVALLRSRASGRPPAGERWGHALKNVTKFSAFGATLLALVLARAAASPLVIAGTLALSGALLLLLERNRRLIAAWSAYVGAFVVFIELRAVADDAGMPVRFDYVVDADRALFGGALPTVWLQDRLADAPGAAPALGWSMLAVYVSYYVVPHAVALVLAWRCWALFRRYAIAVVAVAYAGLLVCALVPTAPPWMAAGQDRIEPASRIVPELANSADADLYAQGSELVGLNPVAAFPSLHTAFTMLLVLAAWRARRSLRGLAAAYTVAMGFALVYLGEHYVVDVAAGVVLATAVWAVLLAAERRRASVPAPAASPAAAGAVATAPARPT